MNLLGAAVGLVRKLFASDVAASPAVTPPAPPDPTQRWVVATAEARAALKWLIGAIAATATVLFGAGPILTAAKIDASQWTWWRYLGFFGGALAGALGLILVLVALLRSLLPSQLSLYELPPKLVAEIDENWKDLFPASAPTVQALRERLVAYRKAPAKMRAAAAAATDPAERDLYLAAAGTTEQSYQNYRLVERDVLDQAGFRLTVAQVTGAVAPVLRGTLLAVLGTGFFLIATSPVPEPAAIKAEPALLSKGTGAVAGELWTQLGLDRCVVRADGQVSVLLTGGTGSDNDPFVVKTLGEPDSCPFVSFNVQRPLMEVVRPVTRKITVSTVDPAPSPTR